MPTEQTAFTEATRPKLTFWFEFASTYSYLSAMRIETMAREANVEINWRPFLLGPIFKAQGWDTSPFNLMPAKGRYMWQDMARQCEQLGLPLVQPVPFPQHTLLAARIGHAGRAQPWIAEYSRAVFHAEFGQGSDISDPALLASLLLEAGADAKAVMEDAASPENKTGLRQAVEEATEIGIFGAPSFTTEPGELYWGNDRLADALAAAG